MQGLGSGVWGVGCGVSGFWFRDRVQGFGVGLGPLRFRFGVSGFVFGFGVSSFVFRFGFGVKGARLWVQGLLACQSNRGGWSSVPKRAYMLQLQEKGLIFRIKGSGCIAYGSCKVWGRRFGFGGGACAPQCRKR